MTTILAVHHKGQSAMAGDGQVTMGESVIMKASARKIRKIYHDQVLVGFAGGVADAMKLEEKFEGYLNEQQGNLKRAAVQLAQEWRQDKIMKDLEALLVVMDQEHLLLISGTGEVIAPDDQIISIGSGGNYALAAARALKKHKQDLSAQEIAKAGLEIASEIDVYTNDQIITLEV
ncbi:HslVU peptidase proteolytic subunit [Allofustis seminis]|uniref:HslVU peptidase proteolytic subunit n=1 Tax=Allofustis seminis TaxID=166939 RepID=UPI000370879A|nr:HslU--HslV peptidase proteolytic subunit [Allofustis seminis]